MNVQELRDLLPLTQEWAYLNTGWAGPTPTRVLRRIAETLEREALLGPASRQGVAYAHEMADAARSAAARLVGASPEELLLTHSTTEGVNVVLHGTAWSEGDELVTCTLEHPAIAVPAQVLAERYGVRVVPAAVSPDASAEQALSAVVSAITSRTRLVALSHIQFTCGLRMPLREIVGAAHERGVPVLVDGAQSVGHVRVDMRELGCDFYAFSGQKWLMGPVGTGALYVRADRASMLRSLFISAQRLRDRGEGGPPLAGLSLVSQSPGLAAGFAEAAGIALETGAPAIEQRALALGELLRQRLDGVPGCRVLGPQTPDVACGLTTVEVEGWTPEDMVEALERRFRIVARVVRNPAGVRFSTAYFNTEEEVNRVAGALGEMAGERSGAERRS